MEGGGEEDQVERIYPLVKTLATIIVEFMVTKIQSANDKTLDSERGL